MFSNPIIYAICFLLLPLLLLGLLGLFLGWLLWRRKTHDGDLTVEGEGALRAEADALRSRVQELEGRVSTRDTEVSGLKSKLAAAAAGAAAASAASTVAKGKAKPKPKAAAKPKVKVLYTDGPTDGAPDDLKLIKGIGPKFEKDLHSKGIYYFRQIGAWKVADVKVVEGVIDSIPGRIQRDEWVKQAKGLASGGKPRAMKAAPI